MIQDRTPRFMPLTGIYEPSAIQQLPDGRFLVVEDEKKHPFSLFMISPDGDVHSSPLKPGRSGDDKAFWKLDDLEGMAIDRSGYIYAITSHSRDEEGERKKSRDKLVRFRIDSGHITEPAVFRDLGDALINAHPVLFNAARIRDVKEKGGLNIEALEISPDKQDLLIGFRSPLLDNRAIIASIENLSGIFEKDESPRISNVLETLDLGGHGIRGMAHVPVLSGYVVISGPVATKKVQFQAWFWSGRHNAPARRIFVPGLAGFEHAEGISPAVINRQQRIIIVSDDGSRKKKNFAHYLLLDPGDIKIAP
jgi:hypothetical protein